ncbi:MAG: hypothetical protein ABI536_00340 [Gallionella sp.]
MTPIKIAEPLIFNLGNFNQSPADDNQISLSDNGPILFENPVVREKIMYFDHDIPERVSMRAVLARIVC